MRLQRSRKPDELEQAQRETVEALDAQKNVDVRGVYEVALLLDGKELKDFKTAGAPMVLSLRCELNPGETGDGVWAYYIPDEGDSERMTDGRRYDDAKQSVIFETRHLSAYAATYEPENINDDGESRNKGSSESGGGCDAGMGGLAALASLAALAITVRGTRGKKSK
ncbi:MAG: hypothetical protein LBG12_15015 [Synergistaceae bacterium]|jgi:hypothetical protein|nr:hypothetical protein [Synergistaceae bacterium]